MIIHSIVKAIRDKVVAGKTKRSPEWPKYRKAWLVEHPVCVVCGSTKKVEVHHKKSFHLFPELELDKNNYVTLCESEKFGTSCHCEQGHSGCFRYQNDNVLKDIDKANAILKKFDNKPTDECKAAMKVFAGELNSRRKQANIK